MREITIKLYKFRELTKEAQEKAISDHGDINVDYDWWDFDYDDMRQVGIEPYGFDLDRGNYLEAKIADAETTAKKILANHGAECETYKIADIFMQQWKEVDPEGEAAEELSLKFEKDTKVAYLKILKTEYEWRTAKEQVAETLEVNDYEFTEDGKLYSGTE